MNCQPSLMLFAGDTPANHSPLPGTDEARTMTATSGRKCSALLKSANPSGSLAKMLLGTYLWGSTKCYLTWRVKATPHNRLLFQLLPSTLRTGEIGSGLLPTPTASQEAKNATLPGSQINRDNLAGALLRAGEKPGGQMNPEWVEWLMGFPIGWTDLDHSEIQ